MDEQYTIDERGFVRMTLPNKAYKARRTIGRVSGDTYYTERGGNCIFRAIPSGGIGFPYKLIRNGDFQRVRVILHPNERVLETSRESMWLVDDVVRLNTSLV